jgi:hypothetical protein
MRRRLVAMATAVALACLPASARADTTGNDLWNWCTTTDPWHQGICYGFVSAIAEAARHPDGLYGVHVCLPEESTWQQTVDVVKRWLNLHPEERHYAASGNVTKALAAAFPCKL